MSHKTTIGKTCCFFCKKIISRNGFGYVSHMRTHVREGICHEQNDWRTDYKREFINLRHPAKVGTIPMVIVFKEWYVLTPGIHVWFREENGTKWFPGIITEVNEQRIFITLH